MNAQRLIGGLVLVLAFVCMGMWHDWFPSAHAADVQPGDVVLEAGADVGGIALPDVLRYVDDGIRKAGGHCDTVTNARPMGVGVRIACNGGDRVYFIAVAGSTLFVTDITASGR